MRNKVREEEISPKWKREGELGEMAAGPSPSPPAASLDESRLPRP